MKDLAYNHKRINTSLFETEMRAVLGEQYRGMSTGNGIIRIHLDDSVNDDGLILAKKVYEEHNPEEDDQQTEVRLRLQQQQAISFLQNWDGETANARDVTRAITAIIELLLRGG